MSLPAWVGTGLIVGSFASWVMDGSDPDDRPDQIPIVGLQVSITPSVSGRFIYNKEDGNLVTIESLRAVTNEEGVLGYYEDPGDPSSWRTGIRAVSPQDEGLDPNGWTYRIRIRSASNAVLAEYSITFAPDEIVDLATVTPVPPSPGTAVAEWERVRGEVQAEAAAAVASAVTATDARDEAVAARNDLVAVEATNDGIMSSVLQDPESEFATGLNAAIGDLVQPVADQVVDTAVAGQDIPGQASTQVAIALAAQAGKVVQGVGMPNGIVTATPGTLYVDTASTNGASVWRKASGTGSSGWLVVEGDTGLRGYRTADLAPGYGWYVAPHLTFAIQRVGNTVTVGGYVGVEDGVPRTTAVLDLPLGFRPTRNQYIPIMGLSGSQIESQRFTLGADGKGTTRVIETTGAFIIPTVTFATGDDWPAPLPLNAA